MTEQLAFAADRRTTDEIGSFLAAVAVALRETVGRLDATVGRITEITAMRPGRADRDVVMTLQDFDRLQQEFAAIANVLSEMADKSGETWQRAVGDGHPARDAIASISVADLKERLLRHLDLSMMDLLELPDDAVF